MFSARLEELQFFETLVVGCKLVKEGYGAKGGKAKEPNRRHHHPGRSRGFMEGAASKRMTHHEPPIHCDRAQGQGRYESHSHLWHKRKDTSQYKHNPGRMRNL